MLNVDATPESSSTTLPLISRNLRAFAADLIVTVSVSGTSIENQPSASAVAIVFIFSDSIATWAYGIGLSAASAIGVAALPDTSAELAVLSVAAGVAAVPSSRSTNP